MVTAQKRGQDLQSVPLSMSVLTAADWEKKAMTGFRDWSEYVAGIKIYQGGNANRRTGPTAVIRGVAQVGTGSFNETSAMATTSYTFGQLPVFSGDPGVFDINRLEVLRGPQGTLFGLASMGGTVRFIPNQAQTDKFAAEVNLTFATRG